MRAMKIFLGTISGRTDRLYRHGKEYIELTKDIYNLDIPTTASDRINLRNDRVAVLNDMRIGFNKQKREWQNNKGNSR